MEKINDTLLISIDIGADNGDLSIVEVITHVGTVRTVINTYIGDDAELIYKVLTNKYDKSYLQKLKERPLEGYFETHYALPEITWETDANKEITEMIEPNIASEVEAAEPKEREVKTFYFNNMSDAEAILRSLKDICQEYGMVALADYYDQLGEDYELEDNGYGWTDMSEAQVIDDAQGFFFYLPKVKNLNDDIIQYSTQKESEK